ncbi:MAG TPA: sulfatase-like hydrolase/transferase [Vicinamibacterales bacterium]|nr:sulfatase-like hydrolase/transferase [Vicinamibacterales bacterium]
MIGKLVAPIAAAGLIAACTGQRPAPSPAPRPSHVLFITIDTLRPDHLGCYGNQNVATPNIDRLASEGVIVDQAVAQVPLTRPSHASLFTGLYPSQHGIRDNISRPLARDVLTLAEAFKKAGFRTAGFISSIVLSAQSGLGRGFDEFSDRFDLGADAADEGRFLDILEKRGDVATTEAIAWIEAHLEDRTFVWVHLYDPHAPYEPPEPYASRYVDRPYDGEVAWTDELIGRLDAALARSKIRDQTLTVLTSDHGESLGEHGESVHGFFLYQATLKVPLIVRGPGMTGGGHIRELVRSIDVFPTVLDLAGVQTPPSITYPRSGHSFANAMTGHAADDELSFAESLTPRIHYGWSDLRSVTDGRWKYILAPRPELYDLASDPGEVKNLVDSEPSRARALRTALSRHLSAETAPSSTVGQGVPPELVQKLGALGYVGVGGALDKASVDADPKDKVGDYKVLNALLHEGLLTLRDKDYAGAATRFHELHARGVDSFEAHYYYGQALIGLRQWREAAVEFQRAIPRLPGFAASYLALAECRLALRDPAGAIGALHDGERALPSDPRLYRRLGELTRDAGDFKGAEDYLRRAISLDPEEPSEWNSLGMLVGAQGNLTEAEHDFREAIKRDAREARYTYNLGLTLQREHQTVQAADYFRKTLELNPAFSAARERLAELK